MENVFAKPPPAVPQHYKALLQKKEATLAATTDCFAPVSSVPVHLYTSKGIMIGHRKGNEDTQSNPMTSVMNSDSGRRTSSCKQPLQDTSLRLQLEEQRGLAARLRSRIKYLETLLQEHDIPFQDN